MGQALMQLYVNLLKLNLFIYLKKQLNIFIFQQFCAVLRADGKAIFKRQHAWANNGKIMF